MSDEPYKNIKLTYPGMEADERRNNLMQNSLSTRDWFAGMALQGMLSWSCEGDIEDFAVYAYKYADAMLAQRGEG